jgi:hypothetical protein
MSKGEEAPQIAHDERSEGREKERHFKLNLVEHRRERLTVGDKGVPVNPGPKGALHLLIGKELLRAILAMSKEPCEVKWTDR